MANVAERVFKFITDARPETWCDACIARKLALKRPLQSYHVTNVLDLTDSFTREKGQCQSCKEFKTVTRRA